MVSTRIANRRHTIRDEQTERLSAPYGAHPLGHIVFSDGRLLVALCKGDKDVSADGDRGFSSYGGRYTFDGNVLDCEVDMASDPRRIGMHQVRSVVMLDENQFLLRPPARLYGSKLERRELLWERVWRPDDASSARSTPNNSAKDA